MKESKIIDKLFDALKDSYIYITLKSGHVKMQSGATYGDWKEMGLIIDPTASKPIDVAEDFFYNHKTAAKELRTRIAQWRKDNHTKEPVKVMYIDGACVEELELKEFSLAAILDEDNVKEIKEARADNFMSMATNVEVQDKIGQTIVTYFDDDGAAEFYIGTDFTGPRDIT